MCEERLLISLAIESSGPSLFVAVAKRSAAQPLEGQQASVPRVWSNEFLIKPRSHDESLSEAVDSVLQKADCRLSDISSILVGGGPGSFTGVRIALSFAKGVAISLQVPVLVGLTPAACAWHERLSTSATFVILGEGSRYVYVTAFINSEWPQVSIGPIAVEAHLVSSEIRRLVEQMQLGIEDLRIVLGRSETDPNISDPTPSIWTKALLESEFAERCVKQGNAAEGLISLESHYVQNSNKRAEGEGAPNTGGEPDSLTTRVAPVRFASGATQVAALEPFYVREAQAKTIVERAKQR
jgi:tRNA threonylcarbamoyl adenosine modification protein YeaZ